ncbi:hypothetical protein [Kribbella karoonensis]|uniref:Uncharacterized protein n=1 Tax=Kribbella karoonensis TaxID=324851 RepID=A0ABN2DD74_9ACTN
MDKHRRAVNELILEGDDLDLLTGSSQTPARESPVRGGPDVPTDRAPAVRRDRPAARERG